MCMCTDKATELLGHNQSSIGKYTNSVFSFLAPIPSCLVLGLITPYSRPMDSFLQYMLENMWTNLFFFSCPNILFLFLSYFFA